MLLEAGADAGAASPAGSRFPGWQPAHFLVESVTACIVNDEWGDKEENTKWVRDLIKVARMLVERGADINAANQKGDTPLKIAHREPENGEMVEELQRIGARLKPGLR